MKTKSLLAPLALGLSLVSLIALPAAPEAQEPPVAQRAIDEARFVPIGGIEHWISIKGADRDNPVILFAHGGPGNPMSPWSDALYSNWHDQFTIVHWDQRYAGRTYQRNEPAVEPTVELTIERFNETDLTVEQLVKDGIEVSEHLLQHLGKDKLILTGTSWGSVLAVHMAKQRPELYHAYVGVSQMVDYDKGIAASYQKVLDRARSQEDERALETLESLGSPPWNSPRAFGQLRRILRGYEHAVTSPYPELAAAPLYETDEYRAAYTAGEDLSFLHFVGLKNDGMAATIDLYELGPEFKIPIHLIQGEEDLLTVPEITKDYFAWIQAPDKTLTIVPAAGHDPNLAMIATHLETIRERVAPLTK